MTKATAADWGPTRRMSRIFTPAAVGSDETVPLFELDKGERVWSAGCRLLTAAAAGTDSTVTLGDGDDVDGYISATDLDVETATIGAPIAGSGAYLATSGGKVYSARSSVDADYVAGGTPGAVKPRVEFIVWTLRDWAGI